MQWYEIAVVVYLAILIIRVVLSPFAIVGLASKREEPAKIGAYALVSLLNVVFAVALYLTLVNP